MAVESIDVYPTCDIHLLLDGPGGVPTAYQLEVRDYANKDNISGFLLKTTYSDADPTIADVSSTGLITPAAVGETFCRIRHEDMDLTDPDHPKTFLSEIVVRIRVHQGLDSFWIGNNRVTLIVGRDNYVLSVYGVFDDDTIGDISSHPYLTFASTNPAKVEVNNSSDKGRLTGRAVTGGTPVEIRVSFGATTQTVNAFVIPDLAEPRRILERIHGSGRPQDRRNIVFVAEGFTANQKPLFKQIVTLLKDGLFTSALNEPYKVMKDRFNVWLAFEPSPEEGVAPGEPVVRIGSGMLGTATGEPLVYRDKESLASGNYSLRQLVVQVGLPDRYHPIPTTRDAAKAAWAPIEGSSDFSRTKVEDGVLDAWLALHEYFLLQRRDSFFGLINGYRYGDRFSRQIAPNEPQRPVMQWYQADGDPVSMLADRRRLPRDWRFSHFRDDYLRALREGGSDEDISGVWEPGLTIFLVNSALDGGARSDVGIGLSVRQKKQYTELHLSGRTADHAVPETEVLMPFPTLLGSSLEEMVAVLAHELAHSLGLGDEYEGYRFAGTGTHDELKESDAASRQFIASFENLMHHYTIENTAGEPGQIDMDRVKWRLLHRISRCSVLTDKPVVLAGNQLSVRVAAAEREQWNQARSENADVFLRTRNINADVLERPAENPPDPADRWFLEGPLKVQEVKTDGTVVLTGTSVDIFRAGDVLYQPQVENGQPLTVFHPDVLSDLKQFGMPFAKKDDKSKANKEAAYPPDRLAIAAPNFKPRHAAFVVGVYEGGGSYNTRVYRPSGMCKMRKTTRVNVREKAPFIESGDVVVREREVKQFVEFCYVCRYALVNAVDPTFLVGLPYPD